MYPSPSEQYVYDLVNNLVNNICVYVYILTFRGFWNRLFIGVVRNSVKLVNKMYIILHKSLYARMRKEIGIF